MIRTMFTALVFAEFDRIRSTGTTPVITHPCYSIKCSIGAVLHKDDSADGLLCVWGAYDGAGLSSLGCSLDAPQRAHHFIF